jgi:hypothetical protein
MEKLTFMSGNSAKCMQVLNPIPRTCGMHFVMIFVEQSLHGMVSTKIMMVMVLIAPFQVAE